MDNTLISQKLLDSLNHVQYYIQYMNNPENSETAKDMNNEDAYNRSLRNLLLNYNVLPDLYNRREDIYNIMTQLGMKDLNVNRCRKNIIFQTISVHKLYNINDILNKLKQLLESLSMSIHIRFKTEEYFNVYINSLKENPHGYEGSHTFLNLLSLAYIHNIHDIRKVSMQQHFGENLSDIHVKISIIFYCIAKNISIEDTYESLVNDFLGFNLSIEEYYTVEKIHNIYTVCCIYLKNIKILLMKSQTNIY